MSRFLTTAEREVARELRALGLTNKHLRVFLAADKKAITEAIRGVVRGERGHLLCVRCGHAKPLDLFRQWARRSRGACLNRDGQWEDEPMPSSRDDDFFARCRWSSAAEAQNAYNASQIRPAPTHLNHHLNSRHTHS